VREAISNYGTGGKGKSGLLDRLLLQVRGLPRPVLLSLRNTFRRKGRLFMTLGALTISGTLFITVVNVRSSLAAWSDDILETWFNYEVELYLDGSYHSHGVERRAESLPGVTQAEGRAGTGVQYIKPDGTKGATFSIAGLPPDTDFIQPRIVSGRWLGDKDRNAVILSSTLAEDMPDVQVGDEIVLEIDQKEYQWVVVGILYNPFEKFGYADFDYISSVKGESGLASTVYVRTVGKDGQSQSEMAEALEERLKESGIKVNQSITKNVLASSWAGQFDFLIAFLMAMAAMTALIGGLGLAGMMSLNVMERTREIGVMRSIGASNSMVSGVVVTEGLLIGVISWILSVPLSVPMSLLFNNLLGDAFFEEPLAFIFSASGLVIWLVIVAVISVVASLLPAYRATKMSVRETLAYE
jgi:putative ABC transport system permease protein